MTIKYCKLIVWVFTINHSLSKIIFNVGYLNYKGFIIMDAKMTATEAARFLNVTVQAVHKRLKTKNLPFKKSQNRIFFGYETSKELFSLKFNNRIIGIQNLKGGVGKTELVYVIATKANLYGAKVLCIDLDMQGNLTEDCFRVNAENSPVLIDIIEQNIPILDAIVNISPGLDIIPSRLENGVLDNTLMLKKLPLDRILRDLIDPLRSHYDLILIDCPPALGQAVTAASLAVDEIIAPVTPDRRSLSGLKLCQKELSAIEHNYKKNIPFKIILNKFDTRNTLSHETLSSLMKHPIYGDKLYKSYIRTCQEFPNSVAKGESIFKTLRETVAKEDIDLFVQELLGIEQKKIAEWSNTNAAY
jgi:chromosome partitioning protein